MSDYIQEWHVTDARRMYILLRVDALKTAQQNLFACTEVIDENSFEFYAIRTIHDVVERKRAIPWW